MLDPHAEPRPSRNKRRGPGTILTIGLTLLVGAGLGWYLRTTFATKPLPSPEVATDQPPPTAQMPTVPPMLASQIEAEPEMEPLDTPEPMPPQGIEPPNAQSRGKTLPTKRLPIASGDQAQARLTAFFRHLETQAYINEAGLAEPPQKTFSSLSRDLLSHPPTITGERRDLLTLLKNSAHFFRVLGKDNILLLKAVLQEESDQLEEVAAALYQAIGPEQQEGAWQATLPEAYEYAAYFLNTMGGQSFLFRRDSRSRLLLNYYALLLIDQANQSKLNHYGIDIRASLSRLIDEIDATTQLRYQAQYLQRLDSLVDTYGLAE
jgi:hypothetical protein